MVRSRVRHGLGRPTSRRVSSTMGRVDSTGRFKKYGSDRVHYHKIAFYHQRIPYLFVVGYMHETMHWIQLFLRAANVDEMSQQGIYDRRMPSDVRYRCGRPSRVIEPTQCICELFLTVRGAALPAQ